MPRSLRAIALTLALLISSWTFGFWGDAAPRAAACSCVAVDADPALGFSKVGFVGEIRVTSAGSGDGEVEYQAMVRKQWKGPGKQQVTFTTHAYETACGLGRIPVGQVLTLIAWGSPESGYSADWCVLGYFRGVDLNTVATEVLGEPVPYDLHAGRPARRARGRRSPPLVGCRPRRCGCGWPGSRRVGAAGRRRSPAKVGPARRVRATACASATATRVAPWRPVRTQARS